eukprot:s2815_g1.t3
MKQFMTTWPQQQVSLNRVVVRAVSFELMESDTASHACTVQRLLLCAEASFIVILLSLLVNVGALVGYTSQDIARSGILPAEQVVWNFQKAMRCVLVVLCFRAGFLHRQKLFDGDAHKWPNLVFTRLSQELWLLPSDEDSGVVYRRYICLALVVLGRAVLGTVRSAIKFHSHMTSEEKVDDKSVDSQICSGQFINWTIFLLDITTNCGFLLGFRAGRHYFAAAKQAFPEESDSAPELTSNGEDSSESRHQSHGEEEPDVPGRRRHSMAVPALRRPSAVQRRVRSRAVGTGDDPNDNPEDEDAQLSPKKCQLPPKEICLQAMCKGEQVDHGPIFSCYAWWTLLGLLVTSAIECLLLSYWEAALLGNRDDEVDVFRMRPYFFSWTPDFGRWRLRRVVLGSWRDLFYFAILYPATASAVFVAAVLAHHFACGRLRLVDGIMHRAVMTIMSYATLLGSQRAYFAMSCLLISWECRQLEIRANDFARRFPGLSPRQPVHAMVCNFLTLDAVEPKRWSAAEVKLFEEAFAERSQAPESPISHLVDDIIREVRRQCLESPTAGLRLALRVLQHAAGQAARSFALDVLPEVCAEWWLLDEEDQHQLYDVILQTRDLDSDWGLQVAKILEVIGQQSDLCRLMRSQSRLQRSGLSSAQSQPQLRTRTLDPRQALACFEQSIRSNSPSHDSPVRVGSGEHPEGSAKEAHPLVDAQASVLACWAADFPWRAVQGAMSCFSISWTLLLRELPALPSIYILRFNTAHSTDRCLGWLQHATLVNEVKELQSRLAPLITYVFVQHLAYLFLDVARQSCDATVPFNMVHYLFRHVMFLGALAVTVWRIGKLNFSIYEKLHNAVMDLLPMNWADLGHCPNVGQTEVVLQRQHMEDWFRYLQHNIDTGRRDACICVFHLRFAAKSHVVALSVLTLLTLPVVNKVLEYYGKQVVNDRLLGGNDVSERSSFLHQMEQTWICKVRYSEADLGSLYFTCSSFNFLAAALCLSCCMALPAATARRCRAAVAAYVRDGHWAGALWVLRRALHAEKVHLDAAMFEMVMLSCSRSSQWARTISLLDDMQHHFIEMTSRAFVAAIAAAERCGRWEPALVLLEDAERLGRAGSPCYSAAAAACGRQSMWQRAIGLLLRAISRGLDVDVPAYNAVMQAAASSAVWEHAIHWFRELLQNKTKRSHLSFAIACSGLCEGGKWQQALEVFGAARRVWRGDAQHCVVAWLSLVDNCDESQQSPVLQHCLQTGLRMSRSLSTMWPQTMETKQQAALTSLRLDSLGGYSSTSSLPSRRILSPALRTLQEFTRFDAPPALGSHAVRELAACMGIRGDGAHVLRQRLHTEVGASRWVDAVSLAAMIHVRRVWTQDVLAAVSYRIKGSGAALCCIIEFVPSAERTKRACL